MTTNNAVNVGLSGSTGTGNFVGSTSPNLTTPNIGAATATSITWSNTTQGINGTTAADSAGSGYVGQVISSQVLFASAVSLTTATAANVTSISLPAGDWNVWGNVFISCNGVNVSQALGWINTTSVTAPDLSLVSEIFGATTLVENWASPVPTQRINVNSTTTVYLGAQATFATGTTVAAGFIFARRMR